MALEDPEISRLAGSRAPNRRHSAHCCCSMVRRSAFGARPFGGCECCVDGPSGRAAAGHRDVVERELPLLAAARLAFLMGASNTSVPRLAACCVEPMRGLQHELLRRILDYCAQTVLVRVPAQPRGASRSRASQAATRHMETSSVRDPFAAVLGVAELCL